MPRAVFEQDLLYSLGAFMTVNGNVARNDAARRVEGCLRGKFRSPVHPGRRKRRRRSNPDPSDEASDLAQLAHDQIVARIQSLVCRPHTLAQLVDAVLQLRRLGDSDSRHPDLMGAWTCVAGRGSLGLDAPRLCVQVKSQKSPADVTVYRTLQGTMQTFKA